MNNKLEILGKVMSVIAVTILVYIAGNVTGLKMAATSTQEFNQRRMMYAIQYMVAADAVDELRRRGLGYRSTYDVQLGRPNVMP